MNAVGADTWINFTSPPQIVYKLALEDSHSYSLTMQFEVIKFPTIGALSSINLPYNLVVGITMIGALY